MSDSTGSLAGHAVLAVCLTLSPAVPALAQQPLAEFPSSVLFLPRYDFHLTAAALSHDDQRFSWDTHFGGDFDLVDYRRGRTTFLANYQALTGSEYRPFDPYQGNYTLEAATSMRAGPTELVVVFNHVSRHLGDRPNRLGVAMNSLGGRLMQRVGRDPTAVDIRIDLRKVIAQAYVDYTWIGDADLTLHRQVSAHAVLYARAYGEVYAVDRRIAGRGRQLGGRVEAGVRLLGGAGSVALFAGYERMVDADPLDRTPQQWAFAGFRVAGN